MQKKQNNKGKTAVKNQKQQSYSNTVLAKNKGKHPEKQDKKVTYYGVGVKENKNVFIGEVTASSEVFALEELKQIAGNDVHSLVVKPFKSAKFHYNNY